MAMPDDGQPCGCLELASEEPLWTCVPCDSNGEAIGIPHCRTCHCSFASEDIGVRHQAGNPGHLIGLMCSKHDRFEVGTGSESVDMWWAPGASAEADYLDQTFTGTGSSNSSEPWRTLANAKMANAMAIVAVPRNSVEAPPAP